MNYNLSVLEQLILRHRDISQDYFREIEGWRPAVRDTKVPSDGKCLPYFVGGRYDADSYDGLVLLGNYLYRCSDVIQRVIRRFTMYAVSTGHQYEVVKRQYPLPGAGRLTVSKARLKRIRGIVDWAMDNVFPGGWQAMQQETLLRYLREGCAIRRTFPADGGMAVRFIEPRTVRGPHDESIWENETFALQGKTVPALSHRLGMLDYPNDQSVQIGILVWSPKDTTHDAIVNYEAVDARRILHWRQGVDSTDPRGVPLFWNAMQHVQRHQDCGISQHALSKVRASYAVIRQYMAGTNFQNLVKVAGSHREADEKRGGEVLPGKEVDAKGFEYVFPDLNIDAAGFSEMLSSIELAIGAYLDMHEWMVTGRDAGGGSSGVVASEGPFDRRVKSTQAEMARDDIRLLWDVIGAVEGLSETELKQHKAAMAITPAYPAVQTRDPLKETQRVIAELHAGLDSPQGACGQLRRDYDSIMEQQKEHNTTYPDAKIITKFDPEIGSKPTIGDNTRANRVGGSSTSGGSG